MAHIVCWSKWALAVAAIMASPIVLVLAVPVVIGLAVDIVDLQDLRLLVLALSGAAGLHLLRHVMRRMPRRTLAQPV